MLIALLAAVPVPEARAQSSDQLGRILGTTPPSGGAGEAGPKASTVAPPSGPQTIAVPILLRAGQSLLLRTGASKLTKEAASEALTFKLLSTPKCGTAREGTEGIVLVATKECVGQKLEFSYEVTAAGAGQASPPFRVDVEAAVTRGIESCGISNAPFNFVSIPAGTYSLANAPARLADIVRLVGKKDVAVSGFCIAEEAVPASEMASFLSSRTFTELRKTFPEALSVAAVASVEIETGRQLRPPAVAVSLKMANGYAEALSPVIGRSARLPTLEEYVAAALHLERNAPDDSATHSFSVSLRGGLIEWTSTICPTAREAFVTIGRQHLSGELQMPCFEPSQRLGHMGFRLVTEQPK